MYYSFEYDYTYADSLSWGLEIRDIMLPQRQKAGLAVTALAIQFLMWFSVYFWLQRAEFSIVGSAGTLFCAFLVVGHLYMTIIEPVLVRIYEGKAAHTDAEKFTCKAEISEEGIKFKNRNNETQYTWDAFHSVHDTEKTIIFIGDTLHAVIPAHCFSHFLEKDAFVRECENRMPAYRPDGPEAFD
jgi:hypothetical protein